MKLFPTIEEEIEETDEHTDKMKLMIDNLKHKLAQSRPGVNTIDFKSLDYESATARGDEDENTIGKLFHTTPEPIGIDKVSQMIGQKIRGMNVGINRLDLDEILDLDSINVKSKGETQYPIPPPGSDDNVSKRQIIHPKLTRKRPTIQKAHIPSINLKSIIAPATDAPNPAAVQFKDRPIIPRYVDEYVPLNPLTQPYNYPSYGTESYATGVQVKELPKRMGPRLQGYKPKHSNPDVKELPPIGKI